MMDDYAKKTCNGLIVICKERKIKDYNNKNKEELIKLLISDETISHSITDKQLENLSSNFIKCVNGYHLINDNPIKETPWEDINSQILNASGCNIYSQSNGSHKSGADLNCSFGALSNKTSHYNKKKTSFDISSDRKSVV